MANDIRTSQLDLFHYRPTPWVCILVLALFVLTTVIHTIQAFRTKTYWLLYTASLCGLVELIGWIGRVIATYNFESSSLGPYILQSILTLFAPTALLAANFILLSKLIARLGPGYSRLSPRMYSRVFLTVDTIALLIQSSGGGLSASSGSTNLGNNISLAGIIFQLVSIVCYILLAIEFFLRFRTYRPVRDVHPPFRGKVTPHIEMQVWGLVFMTVFIGIRSIYRTVELVGGWDGSVASTQWLFVVFDALMIIGALYTLNFLHPGRLLTEDRVESYAFSNIPKGSV